MSLFVRGRGPVLGSDHLLADRSAGRTPACRKNRCALAQLLAAMRTGAWPVLLTFISIATEGCGWRKLAGLSALGKMEELALGLSRTW